MENHSTSNGLIDFTNHLKLLIERRLWLRVIIGMVLGVLFGTLISPDWGWLNENTSHAIAQWIALPGNLFIRLVQMIMIPLVLSSIILGISGGQDADMLRKTGVSLLVYFVMTTSLAIGIGLLVHEWIKPASYMGTKGLIHAEPISDLNTPLTSAPSVTDQIVNILPSNPLSSMVAGEMLSIVVFAIIVGLAVLSLKKDLMNSVNRMLMATQEISITVTKWAMKIAPLAVFGLLCEVTSKVGFGALAGLGMYTLTVSVALIILVIFYTAILKWTRLFHISAFFSRSKELLLLAFSMASSAAVMPISLNTAQKQLGVRKRLAEFIIPVGATINMDGTAIFQVITTLFLADLYGIGLDFSTLILLSVTTVAASIGTPSAPGAGVVILGSILESVGVPITAIGVIIGVERLLGMLRTSVNVMGDLTACSFFEAIERKKLGLLNKFTF